MSKYEMLLAKKDGITGEELDILINMTGMNKRDPYLQRLRRELQDIFSDFGLFLNWHVTEDEEKKFIFYGSNPIIMNGKWRAISGVDVLVRNINDLNFMLKWINRCFDDIGSRPDPYFSWCYVKTYRKDYMDRYPTFAQRWREYKLEKYFEKE